MTNSIRWDLPVETTETPPHPVRVLATDLPGNHPVLIHYAVSGLAWCRPDGSDLISATRAMINFRLRNVAPPKPEPVMREAWINLYPRGLDGTFATKAFADEHADDRNRIECRRIAWMSDGSPVPASPEQFDQMREMAALITERDAIKAEVERLNKANLRLLGEIGQMRPVVDAAVAWTDEWLGAAKSMALREAVDAYQNTPKKTADEAAANVTPMMAPHKTCNNCRHCEDVECMLEGQFVFDENGDCQDWEMKND